MYKNFLDTLLHYGDLLILNCRNVYKSLITDAYGMLGITKTKTTPFPPVSSTEDPAFPEFPLRVINEHAVIADFVGRVDVVVVADATVAPWRGNWGMRRMEIWEIHLASVGAMFVVRVVLIHAVLIAFAIHTERLCAH